MNYSANYNLNKPERSEQFNIDHWNNNTDAIDTQMHANEVNTAQNATDIATLFAGLSTKNVSDTNSVFYKLMKLIYPVGSLYWSANSTNPATLFGGTWSQIKDKFVLACGDTYTTTGATGGNSSVTLAVANLPSHNHSFTPSGTVSITTNPTFTGTEVDTGGMSANANGSVWTGGNGTSFNNASGNFGVGGGSAIVGHAVSNAGYANLTLNVAHTHKVTAEGTISGGAYKFTGTAGTTGSKGSGTAFSIMPPYVVKYCWQRTA